MLGRDVVTAARAAGHDPVPLTRGDLDLTDRTSVAEVLADIAPDAIVNCAAWTDVDGAEAAEDAAAAVNTAGAASVARAAASLGAHLVHVSTDYVFAGDSAEPYGEDAPTGPRTAYGRTKLGGELAVAAASPDHAIARTAWLFGANGKNFVATMLAVGADHDYVDVVDDQHGSPTWTGQLAPALVSLAQSRAGGVHHVAGAGMCTWRDLAQATFELAGVACEARPTTTDRFPRPAPRPAMSALAVSRADTPRLEPWRAGLAGYLGDIGATSGDFG
jgi:dTDP-4-dehydrorhamnose reductase